MASRSRTLCTARTPIPASAAIVSIGQSCALRVTIRVSRSACLAVPMRLPLAPARFARCSIDLPRAIPYPL